MTLFISNPSKQHAEFHFRTSVGKDNPSGPQAVIIPSGGQVEVGHGWTAEQTAYVIKQLLMQGGADAAQAHGKMQNFSGLLYRENDTVDVEEIVTAHDAMVAGQEERSAKQATRSALAFDRTVNPKRNERRSKVTGVEIIQQTAPNQRPTGDEISFNLSVDPENGRSDVRLPI
jgi:hypothetical protein